MKAVCSEREDGFLEVQVQVAVLFHGPDLGAGGEQRAGQRAEPGTDLDHRVAGSDGGELEGFADDVAVHEEILAQKPFRLVAQLGEQVARGTG